MNPLLPCIFSDYVSSTVNRIRERFGISAQEALRKFLFSKTYRMFADPELEMWEFAPETIFELWVCEQVTGDPRNSIYLKA